jgi:hypothetical protein
MNAGAVQPAPPSDTVCNNVYPILNSWMDCLAKECGMIQKHAKSWN